MTEALPGESLNLLSLTDASRRIASGRLEAEAKRAFGQYMTPATVASFMASLFPAPSSPSIRLLDPGAGVGSLTAAFFEHFCKGKAGLRINVDAYEVDPAMRSHLERNLGLCEATAAQDGGSAAWRVLSDDFVAEASRKASSLDGLWPEKMDRYTHCIMNPPYRKISSASCHRACLRTAGIEAVNLYSAFVALSLLLLEDGGHLVAIVPRSFCNGPYHRPFREFMLQCAALRRIHLFGSRSKAFKDDNVLQENIVLALEKGGLQKSVAVSTSTDDAFSDVSIAEHPFREIVREDDGELFIHVPAASKADLLNGAKAFGCTLSEIGIQVSTGPVVDFRMRDQLKAMPEAGTVPLLYPCHFKGQSMQWPIEGGKKPNAILCNADTQKWLHPAGFYAVVRRFSSKEERRRIVAGVVDPVVLGKAEKIGLENQLNVFHGNKEPLTEPLARGLAVFLGSTAVDDSFRRFSGHTQVNATDLRAMKYPSRKALVELGKWAIGQGALTQEMIDEQVRKIAE